MALPAAGVRLVAEDANKFDSALKSAGTALNGFGKAASSVASSVNSAFAGMASAVGGVLNSLGRVFNQIFVSVIRSVVNDAIHQLERFAQAVIDAAIEGSHLQDSIERLGFTFNSVAKSAFAPFVDRLGEMVDAAAPAFLGVVQAAESYLGGLGVNALAWGENFIGQFAQGMWNAVGQIIQVLTDVANMISYWLSPGSPPRILPELDQWGTDAANEFFGGWLQADFSIFNDLSGTLTNLIRSLTPSGPQGGIDVVSRILGTRQGIAAAVEELRTTGTIATTTIDAITAAVGTSDASVRAYLESMVRLQAANEDVRAAQEELNRVTAEYEDLLRPVNEEIAGITEEQQQLVDAQRVSLLQLVLQDPNATASEKRQAQLEIERIAAEQRRRALLAEQRVAVEGAQDELDAAKSAQELAQEEFDARRAQIAAQTEQNNLLREQIRLMEQLNNILGGGGGVGVGALPKPPKLGGGGGIGDLFDIEPFDWDSLIPDDIQAKWDAFIASLGVMGEAWDRLKEKFQPVVDAINGDLVPAFQNLVDAVKEKLPKIEEEVKKTFQFIIDQTVLAGPTLVKNTSDAIDAIAEMWRTHGDTIIDAVGFTFRAIYTAAVLAFVDISASIALAFIALGTVFDVGSLLIQGKWKEAWERLKKGASDAWDVMLRSGETNLTLFFNLFDLKWSEIKTMLLAKWKEISDGLAAKLQTMSDSINTKLNEWSTTINTILPQIQTKFQEIFEAIKRDAIDPVVTALSNFLTGLRDIWNFIQEHVFHIDIPDIPGVNTSSSSGGGSGGGMSMGPPPTNTSGSPVFNSSSQGPTFNYSPTYQGAPPSPAHDFTIMQVFSRAA